jgi:uncharacterized small protein (DUF1192 family)
MTTYYQPLFDYMSNQHGLHLLESDMCEIINIVSKMKKKERIALIEAEISRLKVANRNNIYRIEQIESHLAEQRKGANFSKMNSSEIPNTCLNIKPEAPECVANNGVSDNPVKPNFIPDWKDAPEDAVCVAMEKSGKWFWWEKTPIAGIATNYGWNTPERKGGLSSFNVNAGTCTNAHLLPPDYWKGTLMMRPEANASKVINYKFELDLTQPKTDAVKDYTHLLPEGYEFCSDEDAEKWVKVEKLDVNDNDEYPIGHIDNFTCFKGRWRPIRPIQYKVTTHEITTAVPDPYMPDWSKAPEGTVAHAWDEDGDGYWYAINPSACRFHNKCSESNLTLPPDLDWKHSLRVKPSK